MAEIKFSKLNLVIPIILVLVIVAVGAALILGGSEDNKKPKTQQTPSTAYNSACGVYRNDKTITINGAAFKAEAAKKKDEFAKGLSGRPCILPDQALLLTYTKPLRIGIWMKDMKFPIDVVWITKDHKVAAVEVDFQPSTYPETRGNQILAQYVLELKANRTRELNIDIGTPVSF
ncbi:DUF192 domain-containing protein [Candidatus Saccharibacteria bacterium]|nr:DUF192 domain-containing protein [Candidatus Saccharibacteria bacterium]